MGIFRAAPMYAAPPLPVAWLWEPYFARGKLALLDGDPGAGKTFLALDLAARLSRGGPLPDGKTLDRPHTTLYLSADDDASDTLCPRAAAAGADPEHVLITVSYGAAPNRLPDDIPALAQTVKEYRVDLIVIDPLPCYVPEAAAGGDAAVRRALLPLAALAAAHRCAVLLVRHLTKLGSPRSIYRGLGSIGVVGAVRSGLLVARHPDDPDLRVMAHYKSNLGPTGPSLGFRLAADDCGRPKLHWFGAVDLSADELCAAAEPVGKRPRERAIEWLRAELANGPRRAADLYTAAAAAGIAEKTLCRAKKDFGVRSEQVGKLPGMSEWVWSDPAAETTISHSAGDQVVTLPLSEVAICPPEAPPSAEGTAP